MKRHTFYLFIIAVLCFIAVVVICGKPMIVKNEAVIGQLDGWHNYRTGETDCLSGPPKDYRDYIPQQEPVQMIYEIYLLKGLSPAEACAKTLDIYIKKVNELGQPQKIQRVY